MDEERKSATTPIENLKEDDYFTKYFDEDKAARENQTLTPLMEQDVLSHSGEGEIVPFTEDHSNKIIYVEDKGEEVKELQGIIPK